jgi:hypothetical protein
VEEGFHIPCHLPNTHPIPTSLYVNSKFFISSKQKEKKNCGARSVSSKFLLSFHRLFLERREPKKIKEKSQET